MKRGNLIMTTTMNGSIEWESEDDRRFQIAGASYDLKVTGEESGGVCAVVESTIPPHFAGPPAHVHRRTTEVFYIVSGTVALTVGQKTVIARPGDVLRVPPNTVHRFWNPTAAPATYLNFLTPGGFEQYFVKLAKLMASEPSWPPADMTQVLALGAQYDLVPA
jgi:mannose-6-phosphate isomerase-like protein (cupin superfamily)